VRHNTRMQLAGRASRPTVLGLVPIRGYGTLNCACAGMCPQLMRSRYAATITGAQGG